MSIKFKIGEVARRAQCPVETIRYYEREGLLPKPTRTVGNYRIYGREHLDRLSFIRNCRSLDMALDEIRELLGFRDVSQGNCDAAHSLIDEHIAHVATRISDLKSLEAQLRALRQQCQPARAEKECGILDGLEQGAAGKSGKRKSNHHIRGTHRG